MKSKAYSFLLFIKKPLFYIPVLLILIAGGTYAFMSNSSRDDEDLFAVTSGEFVQNVSVTGKVVAAQEVDLGFEQAGRVSYVRVKVGDKVWTGQAIAALSNADLLATVAQREAQVEAEQAQLAEIQRGSRPEDLRLAENNVDQAKLSLVDAIRDSYTKSDDALRKNIDQLYTDPRSVRPQIIPSTDNYALTQSLNDQRVRIGEMLLAWSSSISSLSVGTYSDSSLMTARVNVLMMQKFLDDLSIAVSSYKEGSLTQTTIDKYRSDISSARSSISGVITSLNNAESSLKRYQDELVIKQAGSTVEEINTQLAQVKSAQAQLASARALVGKTVITAPFNGVITKADIRVGEIASPNTSVISIISAAEYQIESFISETDVAKIQPGQKAKVTLDSYGKDIVFDAEVSEVDPAETVLNGISTYKTKLQFNQADPRIKSGMTANISIETARRENSFKIPQQALFLQGGEKAVTVVNADGSRINVIVVTGSISNDGDIEIVSGLSEGDRIVVKKIQ
ncbi:MAG: efflux RND transporter periplasmic adaptor subunit [Patescibacteria group bacterium]